MLNATWVVAGFTFVLQSAVDKTVMVNVAVSVLQVLATA